MSKTAQSESSKWGDLQVRLVSGGAMLVVGLAAISLGGVGFELLVVFATGLMVWELARLCDLDRPNAAVVLGLLTAAVISAQQDVSGAIALALYLLVPLIGFALLSKRKFLFLIYALAISVATGALIQFRADFGADWIFWMILVIIASDTLGYLIGRSVGGPKFWPKISPKKTWSGTVAGWVGAALVGIAFALWSGAGMALVGLSILVAFAGQMGDIAESALKRLVGIKDSSDLIPGHGGLLDRFDAMLGAVLLLAILVYGLGWNGVTF